MSSFTTILPIVSPAHLAGRSSILRAEIRMPDESNIQDEVPSGDPESSARHPYPIFLQSSSNGESRGWQPLDSKMSTAKTARLKRNDERISKYYRGSDVYRLHPRFLMSALVFDGNANKILD